MIDEKQLKLVELLVEGEYTIGECCKRAGVAISTYYDWRKNDTKPAREFNKLYDEALEVKVKESRRFVQSKVNDLLGSLFNVSSRSKNDVAKVQAVAKLFNFSEMDPEHKQEITINNKDDNKNDLLEKWKQKKEEDTQEEE